MNREMKASGTRQPDGHQSHASPAEVGQQPSFISLPSSLTCSVMKSSLPRKTRQDEKKMKTFFVPTILESRVWSRWGWGHAGPPDMPGSVQRSGGGSQEAGFHEIRRGSIGLVWSRASVLFRVCFRTERARDRSYQCTRLVWSAHPAAASDRRGLARELTMRLKQRI